MRAQQVIARKGEASVQIKGVKQGNPSGLTLSPKGQNRKFSSRGDINPKAVPMIFPTVGVAIPTLNEEKNIQDVICRLKNLGFFNILVIDGKSKDHTLQVAEKNGAKVVIQDGLGKGNAIRQALNNEYFNADALVLMDADGSMAPEEIPLFLEALNSGADVVKGSRFLQGGYTYDMDGFRRFGNTLMVSVVNLLWSAKYTDLCYGYFALNKRAVQKLAPILESDRFEIETELFIKALQAGLVVKEVPSVELPRKNGNSNLDAFVDGVKIFRRIFREMIHPSNTRNDLL